MNITVRQDEIQKTPNEAIVVNLFQGARPGGATAAVDAELGGLIGRVVDSGDFTGAKNRTLMLYPEAGRLPARRVLLVGLGPQKKFDLETARQVAGTAARRLQNLGVEKAATVLHGAGAGGLEAEAAAQAVAEASVLACYRFDEYKSKAEEATRLRQLTVVEFDGRRLAAIRRGVRMGRWIAEGTCLARDLVNHPGNTATPAFLARRARSLARRHDGLRCRVLDEAAMRKEGMGALLGVSAGSAEPAKLILLEHGLSPRRRTGRKKPLVFVGKGVTFDSGGISIKPGAGMADMKMDMSGAAAVIGAMQVVAQAGLEQPVVGIVPATENLLDGKAYKPGDVLTSMAGKTIEIDNTDAEGRLILADALSYAQRYEPAAIVDLATLTGACVVALGSHASGLMGNDDGLAARVEAAAAATAERVWRLPLWPEYRDQIKSQVADMKNTGGRDGGAITAAALLAEFAGDTPWVHLDIAGTAWTDRARPYVPRGGVGVGVRLLVELARRSPK